MQTVHSFIHIRLLRTVKPQLYTKIKQSACLKFIKVNTISVQHSDSKIAVRYSRNAVR